MLMLPTTIRDERGSAMVAAIAIGVIAAFVIVAVMVNGMSSRDGSRSALDRASTEQLARDAGTTLGTIYSAVESGEFDNFVPSPQVLARHASSTGAKLEANPAALGAVDTSVPATRRRSVCRPLEDGRYGCWQLFAVKSPTWGTTKAGSVTVYVRSWTRSGAAASARISEPMMYRLDMRPTWMSDYQMIVDGKMAFAAKANINGRIHSNGRASSFFNQYNHPSTTSQVTVGLGGAAFCAPSARISTTAGLVNTATSPSCTDKKFENTKRDVNLLRAQALARRLRYVHDSLPHPNLQMISVNNTAGPVTVTLSGTTVGVSGGGVAGGTRSAAVTATNNGAVVIASGDVNIKGTLGTNARALIVAMSPNGAASATSGSAPSVTITNTGTFGAANHKTSSVGIVAQGDVIIPSRSGGGCSVTARGAFTAMSGLMSIDRKVRVPLQVNTGSTYWCGGSASIIGSIGGHHMPQMSSPANNAGFNQRYYSYLPALFDNPPPMYPTAFDWQVSKSAPADLRCFNASGVLTKTTASGCVA